MSAQVVAVTALLLDVLDRLETTAAPTPSEALLQDLLANRREALLIIRQRATTEMHALAPSVLSVDGLAEQGAAA